MAIEKFSGVRPDPEDPAAASLERKGYLAREGDALVPFSEEFARFVSGYKPGRAPGT